MNANSPVRQQKSYLSGIIEQYDVRGGYGDIIADEPIGAEQINRVFFHYLSIRKNEDVAPGDRVIFYVSVASSGLMANDVHREELEISEGTELDTPITSENTEATNLLATEDDLGNSATSEAATGSSEIVAATNRDWLAQALLARDQRNNEKAIQLYERGLTESPSIQLILSYAATLKNTNRGREAIRVYEKGIELFPTNAKLREDAGVLSAKLRDYQKSRDLLRSALSLIDTYRQGGKKGVLLALARTSYQMGELQDSIDYFEKLSSEDNSRPSRHLEYNLARIRIQHQRGELAIKFFRKQGFNIVKANLLFIKTEGADLILEVNEQDYIESYGLATQILARVMFKRDITLEDLQDLDNKIESESGTRIIDDQVAFIVTASLPLDLEGVLRKRVENKGRSAERNKPAIIPIQQEKMERQEPNLLRNILNDWLYQRDLFAGNRPVVGRRFFGRDQYLVQLRDIVIEGSFAGVFGLRKVGKTSLLQESQQRMIENGDFVIYRELGEFGSGDCRRLYYDIVSELRLQIFKRFPRQSTGKDFKWRLGGFEDYLDIPENYPVTEAFDSDLKRFFRLLEELKLSTKPHVVVLLDEIERLVPIPTISDGFKGYFEFLSKMRAINQQNHRFNLIVAGANPVISETSQFNRRDNPVFNYFKEIYLAFLERNEADTMLRQLGRGMGVTFTSDALSYLYQLTAGHPFITRQLCSYVIEGRERPLVIHKDDISKKVDAYLNYRSSDFGEILDRLSRDFPEEYKICLALGKAGGRLPIGDILAFRKSTPGEFIRHLTGYQIFREDGKFGYITMDLLTRWLTRVAGEL